MSEREINLQVAQGIYSAFGNGDIPAILSLLADDIEWEHPGPSAIPWAGSFRGHDGVVSFFTAITENADFLGFEPQTFVADGNRVLVLGTETLKNKANDREWHTDWCHDYTLKDGKVTKFQEFTNTAAVASVFI
jgi:ketosteroid isomerase-like protein